MIKLMRRAWSYMTALLTGRFNEAADPKIQLEQAIQEAQEQHRILKERAANVIANQKQSEMRMARAMEELEKLNGSTRQAVLMTEEAKARGEADKAAEYEKAAETFANRLIAVERQVDDLKALLLQATQASDQAKTAVNQNSMQLQKKLAERQKLLSQIDQAAMAQQMNKAMSALSESVGQDTPTFDEVRDKVEAQYAQALGQSELQRESVEGRILEVEQAQLDTEAQSRLSQIRSQLGITTAPTPTPAVATSTGSTSAAPAPPAPVPEAPSAPDPSATPPDSGGSSTGT